MIPGQFVRWKDPQRALRDGLVDALGPGPFEVVAVVDRGGPGLPRGLVLKTQLGEEEVNEFWLTPADRPQ